MNHKTIIITGAANGIGKHWATVLANRLDTYQLVLADLNITDLQASFTPSQHVSLHTLDIRSSQQWRSLIDDTLQRFGKIDYLFNIAGANRAMFFRDQPLEAIDNIIDTNLKGALLGMKLVGQVMLQQKAGHIINVASLAGLSPTPGNALYSAAKGGLRNATIATAIEWHKLGVALTVISPDLVDTPILTERLKWVGEESALTFSGTTLTVFDLERAFWKAMRHKPLEINLPRWRGWLTKLNHANPAIMFWLYDVMKKRGMKRINQLRRERNL